MFTCEATVRANSHSVTWLYILDEAANNDQSTSTSMARHNNQYSRCISLLYSQMISLSMKPSGSSEWPNQLLKRIRYLAGEMFCTPKLYYFTRKIVSKRYENTNSNKCSWLSKTTFTRFPRHWPNKSSACLYKPIRNLVANNCSNLKLATYCIMLWPLFSCNRINLDALLIAMWTEVVLSWVAIHIKFMQPAQIVRLQHDLVWIDNSSNIPCSTEQQDIPRLIVLTALSFTVPPTVRIQHTVDAFCVELALFSV